MPMPGRQFVNGKPYRYGYQGEFAETDTETGKPAFQLRLYDPRINRWLSPDPMRQYHSPYMAMGNNPISRIDPDGGTDIIYLDSDGTEIDRFVMAGEDIYYQANYGDDLSAGLNIGSWEQINLTETFASFDAQRSFGFRVDGMLSLMQTFDNGLTRTMDSWSAISGSRELLPIPNGDDWQLSNFNYRDERGSRYNDRMIRDGVGFSVNITPDPRYGRSLLRVHPDGNLPGTQGCIGLTCGADRLSTFEDTVKSLLNVHSTIRLQVSGSYNGPDGGWLTPNK